MIGLWRWVSHYMSDWRFFLPEYRFNNVESNLKPRHFQLSLPWMIGTCCFSGCQGWACGTPPSDSGFEKMEPNQIWLSENRDDYQI